MRNRMKDYYAALGVSKDANLQEIKRAYRKLAHQYHPDKAGKGNEEKFKEINEAYQVLSDPQKRQAYDQFGSADFASGFGGSGAEDIFRHFGNQGFGSSAGFGSLFDDLFGFAFAQMQVSLEVSLTQALLGDQVTFEVQGEKLTLDIPPGSHDGATFRFPGRGASYRGGRGDLLVSLKIRYPRQLTSEQKRLLQELKQTGL